MALLTAMCFLLLSASSFLLAGRSSWLFRLFDLQPSSTGTPPSGWFHRGAAVSFVLLAAAIGMTGAFYLKRQARASATAMGRELSAVADLRVNQIAGWYRERRAETFVAAARTGVRRPLR